MNKNTNICNLLGTITVPVVIERYRKLMLITISIKIKEKGTKKIAHEERVYSLVLHVVL
jgi:hypothetical protein